MALITRRPFLRGILACAMFAAASCAHGHRNAGVRAPTPIEPREFVLEVINHHLLDVTVYIVHDGQRSRVGTVTATSTQSFTLPASLLGVSHQVSLIGDAIGSPDVIRTETLLVQPGQIIEWTLGSSLRSSSVAVY